MSVSSQAWRRCISLALGGLAMLVVVGLALRWRDLWLRSCRERAAEACLRPDFSRSEGLLGPHWVALFNARQAAYPHLAVILCDRRKVVWQRAATAIDKWTCGGEAFAEYLRQGNRLAALRYTFGAPCNTRVSADAFRDDDRYGWYGTWHTLWSGGAGDHLEPFDSGIDELEALVLAPTDGSCPEEAQRAVRALAAMLRPGEADAPASAGAERIRSLLERVAGSHARPEVRLAAIHGLLFRSESATKLAATAANFVAHPLHEWLELSTAVRFGPRINPGTREETVPGSGAAGWQAALEAFSHPWSLVALAHLDHPLALLTLERLRHDPGFSRELDRLQDAPPPIARLPFPRWRPTGEAVARFFGGGPEERCIASAVAAELNLRELVPRLRELAARTGDKAESVYHEASLLALGVEDLRARMREALAAAIGQKPDMSVVEYGEGSYSLITDLPDSPGSWVVEYEGNSDSTLKLPHLARCLLLAGDGESVALLLESKHLRIVHFEDHIEGLPTDTQDDERYAFGLTTRGNVGNGYPTSLADWWRQTRPTVNWDAARRKFVIPGARK